MNTAKAITKTNGSFTRARKENRVNALLDVLAGTLVVCLLLAILMPALPAAADGPCQRCDDGGCPKEIDPMGDRQPTVNGEECAVTATGYCTAVNKDFIPVPPRPSYAYCAMKFLYEYCGAYDAVIKIQSDPISSSPLTSVTIDWGATKKSTFQVLPLSDYYPPDMFCVQNASAVKGATHTADSLERPYVQFASYNQIHTCALQAKDGQTWPFTTAYSHFFSLTPFTVRTGDPVPLYSIPGGAGLRYDGDNTGPGGASRYWLDGVSGDYTYVFLRDPSTPGGKLRGIELWPGPPSPYGTPMTRVEFEACDSNDPFGPEESWKGIKVTVFSSSGTVKQVYWVIKEYETTGAATGQATKQLDGLCVERMFAQIKQAHPTFDPYTNGISPTEWGYIRQAMNDCKGQTVTYDNSGRVESITNCTSCGSGGGMDYYSYGSAVSRRTLTAHWRFDYINSGTTPASTGGTKGTISGGASAVTSGKVNGAVTLNGTNAYITMVDAATQRPGLAMSFGGWFKFNNLANNQTLVSKYDATTNAGYKLALVAADPVSGSPAVIRATMRIGASGGSDVHASFPVSEVNTTEWWHVMATYDGAAVRLYVNGEEKASVAALGSLVHSTGHLRVGAAAGASASAFFSGAVDELCIYDYALSEMALAYLAEGELHPFQAANLNFWSHWRTVDTRQREVDGGGNITYTSGGTVKTIYYNADGLVVHKRSQEYERADGGGGSFAIRSVSDSHEHYVYNGSRRVLEEYSPSAYGGAWSVADANNPGGTDVDDFDFFSDGTFAYLDHLHADQGLITLYAYYPNGGQMKREAIRKGAGGTIYPVVEYEYYSNLGINGPLKKETRYLNPVLSLDVDGEALSEDNSFAAAEVTEYFYDGKPPLAELEHG